MEKKNNGKRLIKGKREEKGGERTGKGMQKSYLFYTICDSQAQTCGQEKSRYIYIATARKRLKMKTLTE